MLYSLGCTYLTGLGLGSLTFISGAVLDHTLDRDTSMNMMNTDRFLWVEMYLTAGLNLLVFAPLYFVAVHGLVRHGDPLSPWSVLGILATHALWYYCAHRAMHTNEALKPLHRFHHLYKKHIVPSVGNAVTVGEMAFAYLTPFVIHCALFHPAIISLVCGVGLISFFNLVIHSTTLSRIRWPLSPAILVSPAMHIAHHNLYLKHFAAPIFNVDALFECLIGRARH